MNKYLPIFLFLFGLGGCTIKGEYACGVPKNGVKCQSLGETHKQLYDGTLASLHTDPFPDEDNSNQDNTGSTMDYGNTGNKPHSEELEPNQQPVIETLSANQAILSQPREMRIWFDLFTDSDGDLHDESFVFIRIDNGHWVIDNKPVLY